MPGYVFFLNTVSNRTISTNVAASTFLSIFDHNPILSAGNKYCIEFCATILSFSTGNHVDTFFRLSGTGTISSVTMTTTTAATHISNAAVIHGTATTIVATMSSGPVMIHTGANNQPNRNIHGQIILLMSSSGSVVMQFYSTDTSSPILLANTGMRVLHLGPSDGTSDLLFGSSVN